MKNLISLFWLLILFLFSCVSKSEHEALQKENAKLQIEINELKTAAPKLLAEIKLNYKDKNYSKCKEIFEQLKLKHPEKPEFNEANLIIETIVKEENAEIEKIEKERKKREEEKLKALNKLRKNFDDVSGITWYKNPYFSHYTNRNYFSIYIGQRKDLTPWVRLFASYQASDWIFFEKVYLSYDGNTKEIIFDKYDHKETDHTGGSVWEWIDLTADDEMIKFLWDFSHGNNLKIRFVGKYTKTRDLTWNEKQGLKDVLNGYLALTGKTI